MYIIVTHNQNKTLYNRVFFGTHFMVLLMFSRIHRARPMFTKLMKIRKFRMVLNTMQLIILQFSCLSYIVLYTLKPIFEWTTLTLCSLKCNKYFKIRLQLNNVYIIKALRELSEFATVKNIVIFFRWFTIDRTDSKWT